MDQGGYRSLLGAFELGVTSGHIPTEDLSVSSDQRADIQYAGAASDAAALAAAGKNPNDGSLYFGISTWGNWSEVTPRSTYYVFIDTDGDGTNDYRLHTMRAAGVDTALSELGLPAEFIPHASREEILEETGLSAETIAADVLAQLAGDKVPFAREEGQKPRHTH